jgi:NADH-quinone oxidoreductase subunit D
MDRVLATSDELEDLVAGNEVILARTKGVGILSPEMALAYGVTGPNLRASGVDFDLRKKADYLPYDQLDFETAVTETGDCWDRWWVRLVEIRESAKMIKQAVDKIPSGPLQAKVPRVIKVPKGETYVRAENPKGEMGYHVISEVIPDIVAIMGSLDFVLGDVDR